MSKIGSKSTKPELVVRALICKLGFRHKYRLNCKKLPGKPDIVFSKYKKTIFVNGCFWHSHTNCNRSSLPVTNSDFWKEKISKNINNDKAVYKLLKKMNWKYIVIWQCELNLSQISKTEEKISAFLN